MGRILDKSKEYILALLFLVAISLVVVLHAHAELLINRSLTISSTTPSATTTHVLGFNFPTLNTVGSLVLQYCNSPVEDVPCVAPPGLSASGAVLAAQTGNTGFSIQSQNVNQIILTRAPVVTNGQPSSYTFNNVVNPNFFGSFFLRVSTYASTNGTGPKLDFGATAASTDQVVSITTEVPPILEFCVGLRIINRCDGEGSLLDLGIFKSTGPSYGTTRFNAAANAEFGWIITVRGHTLTSGNNIIPANTTPATNQPGQSQFGFNLMANTNPVVGANPTLDGSPTPNYAQPNRYAYNDGEIIASSPSLTGMQEFTVAYVVNVNKDQAPGFYNTTFAYLCVGTF